MAEDRSGATDVRLRAAVESAPSGLLMTDAAGRIVLVNREIERLFGYRREEILGQSVEALVPERDRRRHPEWREGFYRAPSVRKMGEGRELHALRKDGTEFPVEIGLTPVVTEEGLFVISSVVDITARRNAEVERRGLEEQLRQAQKMEAIGRLAGGVAHDFNNVLAAIQGYAELVRDAAREPGQLRDVEEILRAASRGKELVDRILRFSRRRSLELRPIGTADTVSGAAQLLRTTLPASIEIALDLESAPQRILADTTSIEQIVMNLGTNAAHAMAGGGKLRIEAESKYVRDSFARAHPGLDEGLYCVLRIRDEGSGMDAETRARAFEPFFTTRESGHGSGLGLSIVHGLVRDHGGAVWIDSEEGAGTTVSCLIPAHDSEIETGVETEEALPEAAGERILLVDDEASLAELGVRRLEALGYRTTAAVGAAGALEAVRGDPSAFDLIVTDYSMPGINGIDLVKRLRALGVHVPVLLLSGYVEEFPHRELTEAGIAGVLRKPATAKEMVRAIRAVLESASPRGGSS